MCFDNKKEVEKIAAAFHDVWIEEYFIDREEEMFTMILQRDAYELSKRKKFLGIIPFCKTPLVKTEIRIFPVSEINQVESDSSHGDWFLSFELFFSKKELHVDGILNKFVLGILPIRH